MFKTLAVWLFLGFIMKQFFKWGCNWYGGDLYFYGAIVAMVVIVYALAES